MEQFYFGPPSRRLFGVVDGPEEAKTGLVFCPPCGEEMISSYARLALWSKRLATRFAVLRFHPFGTGESAGTFADFTYEGVLQDTIAAVTHLRERTRITRLGLFGLRFGGFVACQLAAKTAPDFLILWSPIADLRQYMRELLRMRLAAEMVHLNPDRVKLTTRDMVNEFQAERSVDILGYEFSPALYRQMTDAPPWPKEPPQSDVLWLSRVAEESHLGPLLRQWTTKSMNVRSQFLPELPFWEDFSSVFPEKFAAASETWLFRSSHA